MPHPPGAIETELHALGRLLQARTRHQLAWQMATASGLWACALLAAIAAGLAVWELAFFGRE